MECSDAARKYLRDHPSEWLIMSKALAAELSSWAVAVLDEQSVVRPHLLEMADSDVLSDLIIQELLSSDAARAISQSASDQEGRELIFDLVCDVLNDRFQSEVQVALRRWDADVLLHEVVPPANLGYFTFESYLAAQKPFKIEAAVEFMADPNGAEVVAQRLVEPAHSLIRLDLIDLALYRALKQHPELLRTLHWRTFEKLLADVLERFGYEVELQKGTQDGGVDLYAIKRGGAFGPERFLLQAKRWSHAVGVEPVRQLLFLHSYHKMTKSCLATTATFTSGAWALGAEHRWQLDLRDFEGVQEWLNTVVNKRVY